MNEVVSIILSEFYENNSSETITTTSRILTKLIHNASNQDGASNQQQKDYTTIKLSNPKIQQHIVQVVGALDILGAVGFQQSTINSDNINATQVLKYTPPVTTAAVGNEAAAEERNSLVEAICTNLELKISELNPPTTTSSSQPPPAWSHESTANSTAKLSSTTSTNSKDDFLSNKERQERITKIKEQKKADRKARELAKQRWQEDSENRKLVQKRKELVMRNEKLIKNSKGEIVRDGYALDVTVSSINGGASVGGKEGGGEDGDKKTVLPKPFQTAATSLEDQEAQAKRRQLIQETMKDDSLSSKEKQAKIQLLMRGNVGNNSLSSSGDGIDGNAKVATTSLSSKKKDTAASEDDTMGMIWKGDERKQPPESAAAASSMKQAPPTLQPNNNDDLNTTRSNKPTQPSKEWIQFIQQTPRCDSAENIRSTSVFYNKYTSSSAEDDLAVPNKCLKRLFKELDGLKNDLPSDPNCSIWLRFDEANASRRWRSENDVHEIVAGAASAENSEDRAQPLSPSRNNNNSGSTTQLQLRSSPINEQFTNNNNNDDDNNGTIVGSNSSSNNEALPNSFGDKSTINNNSNFSASELDNKIQSLLQEITHESIAICNANEERDSNEAIKLCAAMHSQENNIHSNDNIISRKRKGILISGGDDNNTPKSKIKITLNDDKLLGNVVAVSAGVAEAADVSFDNDDGEMEEDSSLDFGGGSSTAINDDYGMDFDESEKENNSNTTKLQLGQIKFDLSQSTYDEEENDEEDKMEMMNPRAAKGKKKEVYRDDDDESDSSVPQSDEEDDASEYESESSQSQEDDSISYTQSSDQEGSDSEVETDSDEEDELTKKGMKKSTNKRLPKDKYDRHKENVAEEIALHLQAHRDKNQGKEMKKFPSHLKAEILKQYIKENNELEGRDENFYNNFWDSAASMARGGKIVKQVPGGRTVGETSTKYEHTKTAESSAKRCTKDGTSELIARFNGDTEKTKEFAQKCLALHDKRKEFEKIHKQLGNKPDMAEEAMMRLPLVREDIEEIQNELTAAFADGGAVEFDISPIIEAINDDDDVKGLADKAVASMQANSNYDSKLCPQNQKNADKIMKSETCHYFLLVRSLTQMLSRGLAFICKWTDEKGNTFSRIFVSVPDLLLFMYCQGVAKQINGDANDNVREPEPTGGNLVMDILNGGNLINTNASVGEGGFLHETLDGQKRIFQEMEVTEGRDGTIDIFQVSMPITGVTLQLHQVALATGYKYGICTSISQLYKRGRCLYSVLKKGETLSCVPVCPRAHSLVRDGIALDPSERCDGDHSFGRDSIYLQGMSGVQGVDHRENVIRGNVEDAYGFWLNPLVVGEYRGGNPMPTHYWDRLLE